MRFSMPNGCWLSGCRMFFQAGAMVLVSSAANRREAVKSTKAANRNRRSTTDFIDLFSFTYGVPERAGQIFSPRAAGMPRNLHAGSVHLWLQVPAASVQAVPGIVEAGQLFQESRYGSDAPSECRRKSA